jgi:hypothetical protein
MRLLVLLAAITLARLDTLRAATFDVNVHFIDSSDATPGDGVCADAPNGYCTLRAAIEEANALAGHDIIRLTPLSHSPMTPLSIEDDVTIEGSYFDLGPLGDRSRIHANGTHVVLVIGSATVALRDLWLTSGFDANAGGAIQNGGTLTLTRCRLSFNDAGNGAAIENLGTLTLVQSTVDSNDATSDAGGIRNAGSLTLLDSTMAGNTAGDCGGIENTGTAMVVNSTVSGNRADDAGGGICNRLGGVIEISSSTITANDALAGAGVENQDAGSTVTIRNTIVAGNVGADCHDDGNGTVAVRGRNLFGPSSTCTLTGPGAVTYAAPDLGPLQFNGGPSLTHAPLPTSPVIDAADPAPPGSGGDACPAVDQRGGPRPDGAACDIGAVEGTDLVCGAPLRGCNVPGFTNNTGSVLALRPTSVSFRYSQFAFNGTYLGSPPTTTSVRLCLYDRPGGTPRLLLSPLAPAGGLCRGKPCWSVLANSSPGFRYVDPDLTPNGVRSALLSRKLQSGSSRGTIKLRGKQPLLPPVTLPLVLPVTAQMVASTGQCWHADYAELVRKNTPTGFKASGGGTTPP